MEKEIQVVCGGREIRYMDEWMDEKMNDEEMNRDEREER